MEGYKFLEGLKARMGFRVLGDKELGGVKEEE